MTSSPKRQKTEDLQDNQIEVNTDIIIAVEKIDAIQEELDKVNENLLKEILQIEEKYIPEKKCLFSKRNEIIKQIPSFWQISLAGHPEITSMIDKTSEDILSYCIEVDICPDYSKGRSFKILFTFKENPYFYNSTISKEYIIQNNEQGKEELYIVVTIVMWKEGKESLGNSSKDRKSFITWLTCNEDRDMHVAECIRDDVFINPLQYFLLKDGDNDENSEEEESEELDDVLIVETDDDEDTNIMEINNSTDESDDTDVIMYDTGLRDSSQTEEGTQNDNANEKK